MLSRLSTSRVATLLRAVPSTLPVRNAAAMQVIRKYSNASDPTEPTLTAPPTALGALRNNFDERRKFSKESRKYFLNSLPKATDPVGNLQSGPTAPIPTSPYEMRTYRETAWPFLAEYKKIAGHSAEPVFIGTLLLYFSSAELWSHETLTMMAIQGFVLYHLYREFHPKMKAWANKEQKASVQIWYDNDRDNLVESETKIAENAAIMQYLEDRPEFFDIMENQVELQAEVTYRKRLLEVETEIKKRLDYQVEMQNVQRSIEEKHIAAWVEKEVLKSIAEQKDEDTFQACLNDLEVLAATKASA